MHNEFMLAGWKGSGPGGKCVSERQTWSSGAPWWDTASVEIEFTETDSTETVVHIRGNLIP